MLWIRFGSAVMCLGVALGAFGAHALKGSLSEYGRSVYHTGVLYQLVHGLALLVVGWMSAVRPAEPLVRVSGWAFLLGVVLFSGSLYVLAVTEIKQFGMITPFGGLAFLAGWVCLALAAK